MNRLQNILLRLRVGRPRVDRLHTEIATAREQIEQRAPEALTEPWLAAARSALDRADQEVKARRYQAAWRYLHEARQQEIFGYTPARLRTEARSMRDEAAAKLRSWRQLTITDQLKPLLDCEKPGEHEKTILAKAMKLRDEHYDGQYLMLQLVQKQIMLLLLIFLALLAGFSLLFFFRHNTLTAVNSGFGPAKLLAGILAGALGACFSGLLSLVSTEPQGSTPERIASSSVTLARPAIGAASGLAAVLLLSGGLLGALPAVTTLALAFAFGFSERLAIGALERASSSR